MARILKDSVDDTQARVAVLRLADLADEARRVVVEARQEAARIVADARSQAEQIAQQAREAAYRQGLEQGCREGLAQGLSQAGQDAQNRLGQDAAEAVGLLQEAAREIVDARDRLLGECRAEMLTLAIELAEKIVGRVAARDIGAAQANLAKVLELVNGGGAIVVRVNPAQLARLKSCCQELAEAQGLSAEVTLLADESIECGGVKVTQRSGEIDGTISTQMENVIDALLGCDPMQGGLFAPGRYEGSDQPVQARTDLLETGGSA